jgi:hypothetical protein
MSYFSWHSESSKTCKWPYASLTCMCPNTPEGKEMPIDVATLKLEVAKLLVTKHDFLDMDEANSTIEESLVESPMMWHENADPGELANYLAESDDDE